MCYAKRSCSTASLPVEPATITMRKLQQDIKSLGCGKALPCCWAPATAHVVLGQCLPGLAGA